MNIDWGCPFEIHSPFGTLLLNQDLGGGRMLRLNPKRSVGRRSIRANTRPIPQGDGEIFSRRFATGSEMQLAIQFWEGDTCACDDVLVDMYDELRGHLWSLLDPPDDDGALLWTPAGKAQRMLWRARLASLQDPDEDQESGCVELITTIDTPFPYAEAAQGTTTNLNGLAGSIFNNGNVPYYPVLRIYTDGVDIVNSTTGKQISFFGGCLGGGSFIEVETFRGTAYVDGDQANAKPCVDVLLTDFFPLVPGENQIDTTGSVDFLYSDAFA